MDETINKGLLKLLNFKDLKKISKKTLLVSPVTIKIGLVFINIKINL